MRNRNALVAELRPCSDHGESRRAQSHEVQPRWRLTVLARVLGHVHDRFRCASIPV